MKEILAEDNTILKIGFVYKPTFKADFLGSLSAFWQNSIPKKMTSFWLGISPKKLLNRNQRNFKL